MTKLYREILNSSTEDLESTKEYYSIPLNLKQLLKVYQLLQNEDDELCGEISSFLDDEYDINIQFLNSFSK